MDKLCSELFSQEILTQEMLEEAVASATGAHISQGEVHGGGVVVAKGVGTNGGAGGEGSGGVNDLNLMGVYTDATCELGRYNGGTTTTITAAAINNNNGGMVTDCNSSTDGSEMSMTVPSTIAVPTTATNTNKAVYNAHPSPLKVLGPSAPLLVGGGVPQAAALSVDSPASFALHFSNPSNNNFASAASQQQQQQEGAGIKKQRSNSGAPITLGGTAVNSQAGFGGKPQFSVNTIPQATTTALNTIPPEGSEVLCTICHYPGADVRIRCPSRDGAGCAYHARCLDLTTLCQEVGCVPTTNHPMAPSKRGQTTKPVPPQSCVLSCPNCRLPASGMEILPLDFTEMDRVQESARVAFVNGCANLSGMLSSANDAKRGATKGTTAAKRCANEMLKASASSFGHLGLPTRTPPNSGAQPPRRNVQCYDPTQPRTGRWTDEEIIFRDTLISHFLSGSLPLANGLKLNDFLPVMLKSKQSRLAKKMKHAKLSTKYFYPQTGCVGMTKGVAEELSRLEVEFVAGIPDPVERSEVSFHMKREWREHFAQRCHTLSIAFDGHAWLASVDDMKRRLSFEKERHRLVKRRFMMGKAMEKDGEALEHGVFVDGASNGREEFELVVEKSVSNSTGRGGNGGMTASPNILSLPGGKEGSPNVWSSNEPNFKHAAPFLAGIASYIERNGVPFEHVDVWVPSYVEGAPDVTSSPVGASVNGAPPSGNFRLCFGGSVTMGVQVVNLDGSEDASGGYATSSNNTTAAMKRVPLIPDEKSNFSLFGDYSEKFSFNSGCGLPGRIFKSGVPAWEQFVSEAHPSLFERRGGAIQFGIKTAVGMPVDSPNVGRVVLVLYSKYDRCKDETLVGRMMTDLKLLNPCPRWKLVVEVDTPSGANGHQSSSLLAPPPSGSPVLSTSTLSTRFSRSNSASSSASGPSITASAVMSPKDKQIKDLILLLGENITSDLNSPLGQQLQPIMSLRLILLRGNNRTPEEEGLIDTVLVLFESYLHAGRSRSDIAVMVARDFQFHLQHQQSLAIKYGEVPAPAPHQPIQRLHQGAIPPQQQPPHQGPLTMYAAAPYAPRAPVPAPRPPTDGITPPLMAPFIGYNVQCVSTAMPGAYNSPVIMGTNPYYPLPQMQQQQHPRSQSVSYLPRQNSVTSLVASPRSTASR